MRMVWIGCSTRIQPIYHCVIGIVILFLSGSWDVPMFNVTELGISIQIDRFAHFDPYMGSNYVNLSVHRRTAANRVIFPQVYHHIVALSTGSHEICSRLIVFHESNHPCILMTILDPIQRHNPERSRRSFSKVTSVLSRS